MSEWFDNPKRLSGNFRKALSELFRKIKVSSRQSKKRRIKKLKKLEWPKLWFDAPDSGGHLHCTLITLFAFEK